MIDIGRVGLWAHLDLLPTPVMLEAVGELEAMGWPTLWIPEAVGRDPFVSASLILGATDHLRVATGIASIWARDAMATHAAQRTVSEAFPGRFVLGLGVSHQAMVDGLRGQHYDRPLTAMREYLDRMDSSFSIVPEPSEPPVRVLAALRPKMLALAASKADGAHPYFVPVEHTAFAREALGEGALLAPEQAVVLETDPDRARTIARIHTATYVGLPNYTNNLRRFGFEDADFADHGSDRLVDAIVAWGDEDVIVERVRQHHDAGADHVTLQVIDDMPNQPPLEAWRRLASALL